MSINSFVPLPAASAPAATYSEGRSIGNRVSYQENSPEMKTPPMHLFKGATTQKLAFSLSTPDVLTERLVRDAKLLRSLDEAAFRGIVQYLLRLSDGAIRINHRLLDNLHHGNSAVSDWHAILNNVQANREYLTEEEADLS